MTCVGKRHHAPARGGLILKATDVTEPVVVTRNSIVTVILKSGPMDPDGARHRL